MHDCVLIALRKLGYEVDLPSLNRGYTAVEIAEALDLEIKVLENTVNIEMPLPVDMYVDAKFRKNFRKYLSKVPYKVVACVTETVNNFRPTMDCLVEIDRHALAYIDGVYYDGDRVVDVPDHILSIWEIN